ncbi:MAG: hypothetical protein ACNA7E_02460 [Wenzhouxiangellaceae bacterium]
MGKILEYLVARRRILSRIMLVIMALLVVADFMREPAYIRFAWDGIGGFAALYGFVSCVLIIVISKALGYGLLYKPENYYGEDAGDQTGEAESDD